MSEKKQVGAKIDADLWKQLRMIALEESTQAGALLDQAMKEFIEKHYPDRTVASKQKLRRGTSTD